MRPGSRVAAAAGVLLGAGLAMLAAGRAWVRVTVPGLPGSDPVVADGRLVAPAATALALVAVAGAIVLMTSGQVVRAAAAVMLVLTGCGIAALSLQPLTDPAAAVAPAVAVATGTTGAPVPGGASSTAWPAVSGVGGLLVTTGGLIGLARGRRWAEPSRKYEPAGRGAGAGGRAAPPDEGRGARDRRLDAWDRLSSGEDPTD